MLFRSGDIRILATAFAKSFSEKLSYAINEMTPAFLEALEQQPWKGNIRELRNVIERSLIVCEGGRLDICDLPLEIQNTHYECSDDSVGSFELAAMNADILHVCWNIQRGIKRKLPVC